MNISKNEILKKIDDLITIKVDNTFANHLKYVAKFFMDWFNENIMGQTYSDSFIIWQYNYRWGALFYPVIYGTFETRADKSVLILKTRLNNIGKIFNGLIIAGIGYLTIPNCFIFTDKTVHISMSGTIVCIIMLVGFQTVPFIAYHVTKRSSISFLKKYLNE